MKILLQHVVAHDEKALVHEDLGRACLCRSAANGHVEVVKVLLEVGGRDLAMLVKDDGSTCFDAAARRGIGLAFQDACGRAGMSEGDIADLQTK